MSNKKDKSDYASKHARGDDSNNSDFDDILCNSDEASFENALKNISCEKPRPSAAKIDKNNTSNSDLGNPIKKKAKTDDSKDNEGVNKDGGCIESKANVKEQEKAVAVNHNIAKTYSEAAKQYDENFFLIPLLEHQCKARMLDATPTVHSTEYRKKLIMLKDTVDANKSIFNTRLEEFAYNKNKCVNLSSFRVYANPASHRHSEYTNTIDLMNSFYGATSLAANDYITSMKALLNFLHFYYCQCQHINPDHAGNSKKKYFR